MKPEDNKTAYQQCRQLSSHRRTPRRLPRRDLAEIVHRSRTLHARHELHRRLLGAPYFVRSIRHVYFLRDVVQILRGVDLGQDERADARQTHLQVR